MTTTETEKKRPRRESALRAEEAISSHFRQARQDHEHEDKDKVKDNGSSSSSSDSEILSQSGSQSESESESESESSETAESGSSSDSEWKPGDSETEESDDEEGEYEDQDEEEDEEEDRRAGVAANDLIRDVTDVDLEADASLLCDVAISAVRESADFLADFYRENSEKLHVAVSGSSSTSTKVPALRRFVQLCQAAVRFCADLSSSSEGADAIDADAPEAFRRRMRLVLNPETRRLIVILDDVATLVDDWQLEYFDRQDINGLAAHAHKMEPGIGFIALATFLNGLSDY